MKPLETGDDLLMALELVFHDFFVEISDLDILHLSAQAKKAPVVVKARAENIHVVLTPLGW